MLSNSIIQAAVAAQADERILTVLDGIVTGDFDEELSVTRLVKMGHSSGVDTLAGITLILAPRFPVFPTWLSGRIIRLSALGTGFAMIGR